MKKFAAVVGVAWCALMLWAGSAYAQATTIDIGAEASETANVVGGTLLDSIQEVLPVVIPFLILFAVITGIVGWARSRNTKKLTGANAASN